MRLVSAIMPAHQDDVIEETLKARDEWDPPWLRQRRARAPPTRLEIVATATGGEPSEVPPDVAGDDDSQLRPEAENDLNHLPLGGNDDA